MGRWLPRLQKLRSIYLANEWLRVLGVVSEKSSICNIFSTVFAIGLIHYQPRVTFHHLLNPINCSYLLRIPFKCFFRAPLLWLYVLIMSRTRFRVNPHSVVAWMSRNSLLEAGAKSEVLSDCNWTRTHNHLVHVTSHTWITSCSRFSVSVKSSIYKCLQYKFHIGMTKGQPQTACHQGKFWRWSAPWIAMNSQFG